MYKTLKEHYQNLLNEYNLLKAQNEALIKQNKNLQKELSGYTASYAKAPRFAKSALQKRKK